MPIDNFGRNYDTAPTMEDLLSRTKNTSKKEEKDNKEVDDLIENLGKMSKSFGKAMEDLGKITKQVNNQIKNNNKQINQNAKAVQNNRASFQAQRGGGFNNQFFQAAVGGLPGGQAPANQPGDGFFNAIGRILRIPSTFKKLSVLEPPTELQFMPLAKLPSIIGDSVKSLNDFDIMMKRAIYQTTGLGKEAEHIQEAFTRLGETTKRTGFGQEFTQKQMLKYKVAGVKMDKNLEKSAKKMLNVAVAQLHTERQLGLQAGELDSHFMEMVNHAQMTNSEINSIGRGMKEVANNTGLTGKAMSEAISSSKQFRDNLMNAGNLTAESFKNVTQLTASFKKAGVEQLGSEITSYLTDTNKLFSGNADSIGLLVREAAQLGGVYGKLMTGTITKSEEALASFAKGLKQVGANKFGLTMTYKEFKKLSDEEKAELNRRVSIMSLGKTTAGEFLRTVQSTEEAGMSFGARMKNIDEERLTNAKELEKAVKAGDAAKIKELKNYNKQLGLQKVELKRTKASGILGDLATMAEGAEGKKIGDIFGTMRKDKKMSEDLATMYGVTPEQIQAEKPEKTMQRLIGNQIMDLDKRMRKETGKAFLTPDLEKEFLEAIKPEADSKKMFELLTKLQEAEQEVSTSIQENLDPSTRILHRIQTSVDKIRGLMLFGIQEAKQGIDIGDLDAKIGKYMQELEKNAMKKVKIENVQKIDPRTGQPQFDASGKPVMEEKEVDVGVAGSIEKRLKESFGDLFNIPSLAVGSRKILKDGLAYLHKGEMVVPKEQAKVSDSMEPYKIGLHKESFNAMTGSIDFFNRYDEQNKNMQMPKNSIFNDMPKKVKNMGKYSSLDISDQELDRILKIMQEERNRQNELKLNKNKKQPFSIFDTLYKGISNIFGFGAQEENKKPTARSSDIQTLEYRKATGNVPDMGNNELVATNGRIQAQISKLVTNKNQLNTVKEENSSEIVMILKDIRDSIKTSSIGGGGNYSGDSGIMLLSSTTRNVDPRLGAMRGGNYTNNDSIKAMNY